MAVNGCKYIEVAGNCWKGLVLDISGWNGWKWLKIAVMAQNCLKLLEMAGWGYKLL